MIKKIIIYLKYKLHPLIEQNMKVLQKEYISTYLLKQQIKKDKASIKRFLNKLFNFDRVFIEYLKNIKRLIINFILLALFILPLIWIFKLIRFIYSKLVIYIFLISDCFFLDILLRDCDDKFKIYYRNYRYALFAIFYDLLFNLIWVYIESLAFKIKNMFTLGNIITKIVNLLISPIKLCFTLLKKLFYFIWISRMVYIPKFRRLIRNFKIWIKDVNKLFIYKKTKIKYKIKYNYFWSKAFLIWGFKFSIWHIIRLPKRIIKYFRRKRRWFRRWLHIAFSWYSDVIKYFCISILDKLLDIYIGPFFSETLRNKKIKHLTWILDLSFRVYVFIARAFLVNLINICIDLVGLVVKSLYNLRMKFIYLRYKRLMLKYDFLIFYKKSKMFFIKLIDCIIASIVPYRMLYFIRFIKDNIWRKTRQMIWGESIIDKAYKATLDRLKPINFINDDFTIFGYKLFNWEDMYTKYYLQLYKYKKSAEIPNTDPYMWIFRLIATILYLTFALIRIILISAIIITLLYLILFIIFQSIM